jgi:Tfp pilus assembly protein PilX
MNTVKKKSTGMLTKLLRGQGGFSVLVVIFVMLVLSVIGYSLTNMMVAKQKSVPVTAQSSRAFYMAEGGLDWAGKYLSRLPPDEWYCLSTPADDATLNLGNGSFEVTFDQYSSDATYEYITVASTGYYGDGKRTVAMRFQRELPFGCYTPPRIICP